MGRDFIYRAVDIRALSHFHDGAGGLSINAERVWTRLLIGPETTPIPGLVLASRAQLAEKLRMPLRAFDKAFEELTSTRDEEGNPAPMAIANWPLGVVVLPAAPRQPIHRPTSTAEGVAWAKFLAREAPRCEEVTALRDAWREVLGQMEAATGTRWLGTFDELSRGNYAKRSPNDSPNISPKTSPNGSPNDSGKRSGSVSQETGDRRQEKEKASLARDAQADAPARAMSADARFAAAWRTGTDRATGTPKSAGNPGDNAAAWALVVEQAAARRIDDLDDFAVRLVAAYCAAQAEAHQQSPRSHPSPRVDKFIADDWLNRALSRLDGKNGHGKHPVSDEPPLPDAASIVRRIRGGQ